MSHDSRYSPYPPRALHQKLRQSCNRCSAQKIRCSKDRPTCAHCASKNLPCHYSLSQRTGKRISNGGNPPALTNEATTPTVETNTLTMNGVGGGLSMPMPPPSTEITATSAAIADSMSAFLMSDFGLWSPDGFSAPQTDVDIRPDAPPMLHSAPQSNSFSHIPTPHIESYFPEPKLGLDPTTAHTEQQDCMALALSLVQSMHLLSSSCALSLPTAAASHGSPASETWGPRKKKKAVRGMDYVLINNRATIKTIHRILQCSCSQDKNIAFICSLVIEKVLRWYRAATRNLEDDEQACGESENLPEQVMSLPIYMGEYRLNGVSQRSMRANLVLDELKTQMKPLIERFSKRFCTISPEGNENHLTATCSTLDKYLRQRLRDVARAAGEAEII